MSKFLDKHHTYLDYFNEYVGHAVDIVHYWRIHSTDGNDVWHICWMDNLGTYRSGFFTFCPFEMKYKHIGDTLPNWDCLQKGK